MIKAKNHHDAQSRSRGIQAQNRLALGYSALTVLVLLFISSTASASIRKHANKILAAGVYRSIPPPSGFPANCTSICEADKACYGFVHFRNSNLCNFVNRPIVAVSGGLTSKSGVDFYEKVVTTPGTRDMTCTVSGEKAFRIAQSKGFGFECFLYDHTVNVHNIISSSNRFNLTGKYGPRVYDKTIGCVGISPPGFQTLYVNLFRNRKLRNGWKLVDYQVAGDSWNVGPQDNAMIRLKSTRQYKKGERFNLRLVKIVIKASKTGWFFCDQAAADAF